MYKTPNWVLGPNFNVCVCEREREREREKERVFPHLQQAVLRTPAQFWGKSTQF